MYIFTYSKRQQYVNSFELKPKFKTLSILNRVPQLEPESKNANDFPVIFYFCKDEHPAITNRSAQMITRKKQPLLMASCTFVAYYVILPLRWVEFRQIKPTNIITTRQNKCKCKFS